MIRQNTNTTEFMLGMLFEKPVLFSDLRIDPNTVPKCLHMYEMRHGDEDDSYPIEIKDSILVNFYGTVLSKEPIEPQNISDPEEDFYFRGYNIPLMEYIEKSEADLLDD